MKSPQRNLSLKKKKHRGGECPLCKSEALNVLQMRTRSQHPDISSKERETEKTVSYALQALCVRACASLVT